MLQEAPMEWRESWRRSPSGLDTQFGAWPVRAGRNRTKSHYRAGPRVKPDHSIHFVLSGSAWFRNNRSAEPTRLGTGSAFVIFPGVVHEYWAEPSDPPGLTWIAFQGPAASPLLHRAGLTPDSPVLRNLAAWRISPMVGQLPEVFASEQGSVSLRPVALLTSMFAELLESAERRPEDDTSWLDRGRELLDAHCTDAVTVSEIADHVGINRSHFSKEFSKRFGTTPARYLRDARLDHARTLLRTSALSVTEVALSVGYGDLYAFSHAYRQRFGRAPSTDQPPTPPQSPG